MQPDRLTVEWGHLLLLSCHNKASFHLVALVPYLYLWLPGCYLETVTSVEHTPEATDKPVNTVLCLGGLTCSFQSLFPFPSLVFLPGGVVQASGAGTIILDLGMVAAN